MSRQLNLWLVLIVAVCAVSIWADRSGWVDLPGGGQVPDPVGRDETGDDAPVPAVHLLVLNGTGETGLARNVGFLVPRVGCVAERLGNAPGAGHRESLLINRRLDANRAEDLARRLGGLPVLTEWDGRGTEDAVLLLGEDFKKVEAALDN